MLACMFLCTSSNLKVEGDEPFLVQSAHTFAAFALALAEMVSTKLSTSIPLMPPLDFCPNFIIMAKPQKPELNLYGHLKTFN